ncbi:hypothetical protein DSECCO2_584290 [anaerobic digester metagenome]
MLDNKDTGLLKHIQTAVQPLTVDEGFQLEAISYGSYYGQVTVVLVSREMDIVFNLNIKGYPIIGCVLRPHSINLSFIAEYLFSALGFDISFKRCNYLKGLDLTMFNGTPHKHQKIIDYLVEKSGCIIGLNRLCTEIQGLMSNIRQIFHPDAVDETARIYVEETKKRKYPGRLFHELDNCQSESDHVIRRGISGTGGYYLKIEDILEAIDPLFGVFIFGSEITYSLGFGKIDVFCNTFRNGKGDLLYHSEENGTVGAYFILYPHDLIREDIKKKKEPIIFSGKNIFQLLGIDYFYNPKGLLEDINELSRLIYHNISRIQEAFSDGNVERTYGILVSMEGNKEEEIKKIISRYKSVI